MKTIPQNAHPSSAPAWLLLDALADLFGQGRVQLTRQSPHLPALAKACGVEGTGEVFRLLDELYNSAWIDRDQLLTVAFSGRIPEHSWTEVLGRSWESQPGAR
jgi:hypothetical protein